MTLRGVSTVVAILILSVATSWGVAHLRRGWSEPPLRIEPPPASPAEISEAVAVLDGSPAYRGALSPAMVRGAKATSPQVVVVDLDPREVARARPELRGHPRLVGILPPVAHGRIERLDPALVEESWKLGCPDGCALDLLDRDPPPGAPSGAWSVRPPSALAIAWFAFDAKRLNDPHLGGAGLAPWREQVETWEKLLNRPLRSELSAALSGTGIAALEEREPGRAEHLLLALDLDRPDRARAVLDLVVSLAVVGGRGEVRRHRDVAVGVIGTRARRAAVAIDGKLLLVSDDPAALAAAIDRRRAVGIAATPPRSFADFRGSWRAERASPTAVTATLQREGVWWWLKGRGGSPAVTADPVLAALRSLAGGR
ncbi:MAG TPA: hypothetical protein VJ826_10990 [Candidatus Polarisedimenticolaceae bacterium]|nr:hypothetical protein [Candidatus Polarisedimenticolaceae bacterium]